MDRATMFGRLLCYMFLVFVFSMYNVQNTLYVSTEEIEDAKCLMQRVLQKANRQDSEVLSLEGRGECKWWPLFGQLANSC